MKDNRRKAENRKIPNWSFDSIRHSLTDSYWIWNWYIFLC